MEVQLKDVRLGFPTLFEARSFAGDANAKERYGADFIFNKSHPAYKAISDAIIAVAKEKWKDKATGYMKEIMAKARTCLQDGGTKDYSGYEGNWFVRSGRDKEAGRPTVVGRTAQPLTASDGMIYGGCYVNAKVQVWAQDNQYGKRINATLLGVQFLRDGESFNGTPRASRPEDFDDLGDTGEGGAAPVAGAKTPSNDEEDELAKMLA